MLGLILVIVLVLAVVGGLPHWGYWNGRGYGYAPSGIGLVLLIVVLFLLFGGGLGHLRLR